jgi:hypothetical protein
MLYGGILMDIDEFKQEMKELVGKEGSFFLGVEYWFRGYYDPGEEARNDTRYHVYMPCIDDRVTGSLKEILKKIKKIYRGKND